jgi:hypothetical protein
MPRADEGISEEAAMAIDTGILATLAVISDIRANGEKWPGAEIVHRKTRQYLQEKSNNAIPWSSVPPKTNWEKLPES